MEEPGGVVVVGDVNHSPRSPGRMRPRARSLPHASDGPQALSSAGWKRLAAQGGMVLGPLLFLGPPPAPRDAGTGFPALCFGVG